jgi:tetratricopeptide (TPR) repeat protein
VDKFIQEKKLKKGLELLYQAARINPKDPEILVRIGPVKADQNEPAEADRYLSKALQQDPGHDLALIMRERRKNSLYESTGRS